MADPAVVPKGFLTVPVEPSEEIRQLLEKLDGLRAKATDGPWSQDHPTTREQETGEVLYGADGKEIADTYNAYQHVETEGDGRYFDQRGIDNFAFIVALANAYPTLRSLLSAPVGWQLVPVEPTHEMIEAIQNEASSWQYPSLHAKELYRAMLAASPAAPLQSSPWRTDMENAPRDGEFILIWDGKRRCVTRWVGNEWEGNMLFLSLGCEVRKPTAWLPLPTPPSGKDHR